MGTGKGAKSRQPKVGSLSGRVSQKGIGARGFNRPRKNGEDESRHTCICMAAGVQVKCCPHPFKGTQFCDRGAACIKRAAAANAA